MENGHPCKEHLEGIIKVLPDNPGVYQFYNAAGKIIYIGKAKTLKKEYPPILTGIQDRAVK